MAGKHSSGSDGNGYGRTVRLARGCAYYFSHRHELIKRHVESVDLKPDHTADWKLQIDLELPTDSAAFLDKQGEDHRCHFFFPLAYLPKTDARTGFEVRDENGALLTVPILEECNRVTGRAAAEAGASLGSHLGTWAPSTSELNEVLRPIAANTPFESSLALQELRRQIGLERDDDPPLTLRQVELGRAWKRAGLTDVLDMLVENTLVWVPLYGRPGERRSITISQQISLVRRTFVRWIFGEVKRPKQILRHPLRALRAHNTRQSATLELGAKRYGLRGRRISFSALAERIGLPIAWTPCEFEFPTIYTKRCNSYHFELRCPPGRTPRELRPASGTPIAEPGKEAPVKRSGDGSRSRTTLTSNIARHDRPGNDMKRDIWFRVSVGVGDGAFPSLWFLAGTITAVMLWLLADNDPALKDIPAEIMTGILLVVPALAAVLGFGGNDDIPVTRLLGGARVLLLITGLSAVAAAAVVAGAKPFGIPANWSWTICAIAATVATVPMGTSWLLSSPLAWSQLRKLRSQHLQRMALLSAVVLAAVGIDALILIGSPSIAEGAIAVYLLFLTIGIIALANNRVAMPIGQSRGNVVFSLLIASVTCLALACVELRAAIDPGPGPEIEVEVAALGLVGLSLFAGNLKRFFSRFTAPELDEIHVSPQVGRALLAKEAVAELSILRSRERSAEAAEAPG